MEVLLSELTLLNEKLEQRVFLQTDPSAEQIKSLHEMCDALPYYVAIVNISQLQPVFFCQKGMDTLGVKKLSGYPGMTFYARFLSPENFSVVKAGLSHFTKTAEEPFPMTYRIKTTNLGWRWVYGISIPFGDKSNGVKYTLTILRDVEESFEKLFSATNNGLGNSLLSSFKARRLLQLSQREKDVLLMLAEDLTTEEMSKKLNISHNTVQYHRKKLKQKLKVKTTNGLVRYAIHLQTFLDSTAT